MAASDARPALGPVEREQIGATARSARPASAHPRDDPIAAARRSHSAPPPAAAATRVDPLHAVPAVAPYTDGRERWRIVRELLNSDRFAADFVVETEEDARAYLRFGDDVLGRRRPRT